MTQDTRKDPRAKVLTMTVRYKSATLDEFIEHHSHDVSRGGMFIKTPSPFPPGTLLKFEVKIAAEQRVMQGVGRVVWKREASDASDVRPAGMGVKFIKIDDESRRVIDQLVTARGEALSHFEQGGDAPVPSAGAQQRATPVKSEPDAAAPPARAARKSTMIGLGAMGEGPPPAPPPAADSAFFPKSTDNDLPAPEDRTVMKQAAELLKDALREAGGSLDEVGSPSSGSAREAKPRAETPAPAATKPEAFRAAEELAPPQPKPAAKPVSERPASSEKPASSKPGSAAAPKAVPATAPKPVVAPSQRAPLGGESEGGGGKTVLVVAAVALVVGVVFFATRQEAPPPGAPVPEPPMAVPAEPAVPPPTAAVVQPPVPEADPSAAPPEAPSAAPTAPAVPVPAAEPSRSAAVVPATPAPKAAPKAAAPRPKAKPAEVAPSEPVEPAAPATPAAPAEPPAEKPAAAPKPAPEAPAEQPVAPKPAPKPAPKKPASDGDNPY